MNHWNDDSCGNSIGLEKQCVIVGVRAQGRVCNFVAKARRIERARLLFSIFFFFFLKLKELFGRYRFARTDNLKDCVRRQLCKLAGELYDEGIQKLVQRYDKCSNIDGDCNEK